MVGVEDLKSLLSFPFGKGEKEKLAALDLFLRFFDKDQFGLPSEVFSTLEIDAY